MKNSSQLVSASTSEPLLGPPQSEPHTFSDVSRKPVKRAIDVDPLLTAEDVARRLNVSTDWVWDHSSRKKPLLPVIRMGDGALRYRASGIEEFIDERERLSALRLGTLRRRA
jgi:predicted DNA-binding transcriptional regulator AlpA